MLPAALRPLRRLPLRRLLSTSAGGEVAPPGAAPAAKEKAWSDAYKKLEKLDKSTGFDWRTAADIVSTMSPSRKEFGLDFHLVQLFFVCMPSLAVYLVAQYARREIKRMEAEAEEKRKKNEELEKAKQLEADSVKEDTDSKLTRVLVRLDTLEGVVNEIVDEKTKGSASDSSTKEGLLKKGETSSPDRASDSKSNASGQVASVKAKPINGATNASSSSTQQNITRSGDKESSEPKG